MNQHKRIYIFLGPPGAGKGSLSQLCTKRLGWRQLSTGNLCREHIARQSDIGKQIDFAIKSGKLISDSLVIDMVYEWLSKELAAEQEIDRDTARRAETSQAESAAGGMVKSAPEASEGDSAVSRTVILDGFPRTMMQARALHELIETMEGVALHLVHLKLSDEEIVHRLAARSVCQNEKCQRVYSLHKHSHLQPVKYMTCNECEAPLIRRSDDEETAIVERLKIYHAHEDEMLSFYKDIGHHVRVIPVDAPLEDVYSTFLEATGHASI